MKWIVVLLAVWMGFISECGAESGEIFVDGFERFSSSPPQGRMSNGKPREFRPTIHSIYSFGKIESISGVPVPKNATGYFYYDGSTVPTFLYRGSSVHAPGSGPLPPHLSVSDPYDHPPQYPVLKYTGVQDFGSFHGTDVKIFAQLQGVQVDRNFSAQLNRDILKFLGGNDDANFRVDEQRRLIYQKWYVDIFFSYEFEGTSSQFTGGASSNLYAKLGSHIAELVINRRMALFQSVIGHIKGAQVPGAFAASSLHFPYSLNSHLPKACVDAGYGLQYEAGGAVNLHRLVNNNYVFLASLSIAGNHQIGMDCHNGALLLENDEWSPHSGLKVELAEPESNSLRNPNGKFTGAGARYLIRDQTLLLSRRPPLGERYVSASGWQTPAGSGAFKVQISRVPYFGEFDFSGKYVRRPTKWPEGNCAEQKRFALQYKDDDYVILTEIENGAENVLGVLANPKLLHCDATSVRALTVSVSSVARERQSLTPETSDVRSGKNGRFDTEGSGLFQFTDGKLVLAKSAPAKKIFSGLTEAGDGRFVANYGVIRDHYGEFTRDGISYVERPAAARGKGCEATAYGFIYAGDKKTILTAKATGKEVPLGRFSSEVTPFCFGDAIALITTAIEPGSGLKAMLKPGESDIGWGNIREPGTVGNFFVIQGGDLVLARKPPAGNSFVKVEEGTSPQSSKVLKAVYDKPVNYVAEFDLALRKLTLRLSGKKYADCEKLGYGFNYLNERVTGVSLFAADGETSLGKAIDLADVSCRTGQFAMVATKWLPASVAMTQADYPDPLVAPSVFMGNEKGVQSAENPVAGTRVEKVATTGNGFRAQFKGVDAFALDWNAGANPVVAFSNPANCAAYAFTVDGEGISVQRTQNGQAVPFGKFTGLRSYGCERGMFGVVAHAFAPADGGAKTEFSSTGFMAFAQDGTLVIHHEHESDREGYQSVQAGEVVPGMAGFRVTPTNPTAYASGFLANGERLYPRMLSYPTGCSNRYLINWVDRDSVEIKLKDKAGDVPLLYVRGLSYLDCRGQSLLAIGAGSGFTKLEGLVENLQGSPIQVRFPKESNWSAAIANALQAVALLNGKELRLVARSPENKKFVGIAIGEASYQLVLAGEKGYAVKITEEGLSSALEFGEVASTGSLEGEDFFAKARAGIVAEEK